MIVFHALKKDIIVW